MAGYSGTTLVKKLGIRAGFRLYVYQPPPGYFAWLQPLPEGVVVPEKPPARADMVHLFVRDREAFEQQLERGKKMIASDGMIWVSWPKKSSGVETDLSENIIREIALARGLVDIKVCAVDATWSGLKLVIPLKDRVKRNL